MCLGQPAPPDQTQKGHPVESTSVTQPVTKRADQLVVGDRILPHRLPAVASKPGEVLFVQVHEYRTARWVFVAYRLPDGFYDSTAYLPDGTVEVYPEIPADDSEVTQPIAGRAPAELAGGLIQVDPPRRGRLHRLRAVPAARLRQRIPPARLRLRLKGRVMTAPFESWCDRCGMHGCRCAPPRPWWRRLLRRR
jgi:hypothetical protein